MEKFGAQKRVVVLVPFPFQGHITPMLQLGAILHSKGFSIVVAHAELNAPNPLNHPEFVFQPLSSNLPADSATVDMNFFPVILALNKNCKESLENYMVQLLAEPKTHGQVACIIYDAIMYFTESVTKKLKLPSMVLKTGNAVYTQSYHHILQLHSESRLPMPESKLQDLVPELHPALRYKDLPVPVTSEIGDILRDFIHSSANIRSSVAVIFNTTNCLEQPSLSQLQQYYKTPVFPIGPLHRMSSSASTSTSLLEEDRSCIAWLDQQASNSVIYVSLGSLATVDNKELTETAWGLANSGQPFLWVIRPSLVRGSQGEDKCLPEDFEAIIRERGQIVKWAPQKEVLAHSAVGGFWSHCGWNSTMESICKGIPMICTPRFADQMINARLLTCVWKVGLQIDNVTDRGAIERSIRSLMVENEGKEIRQRMSEMKEKIGTCVEKGGSSQKSLNELVRFISSLRVLMK